MKIKRWHVVVLALFVLLCGALFYHFYTERISSEALQAVDFQALRAHTAELLENGFRANDQLFSSDYYDVRPDSTCYIWLNGSENDADTPMSVATGYLISANRVRMRKINGCCGLYSGRRAARGCAWMWMPKRDGSASS